MYLTYYKTINRVCASSVSVYVARNILIKHWI